MALTLTALYLQMATLGFIALLMVLNPGTDRMWDFPL